MRRAPLLLASVLLPVLLAGCGSSPSEPSPITVQFAFDVPAGTEKTQCFTTELANAENYDFVRVDSHMAAGSHHLILYRDASDLVPGTTPPPDGVGDCVMDAPRLLVYTAQDADHYEEMPAGVAGQLPKHARVILEAHYVNASTSTLHATAEVTLTPAKKGTVKDYAGILFYMDTQFQVPPGSAVNGNPMYTHETLCPVPPGIKLFRMGSHTHKRGLLVDVYAQSMTAGFSPTPTQFPIYQNTDWSSPAEKDWPLDEPLVTRENEGLKFRCGWSNETASAIGFGPSVEDEMCIIGAGYYPRVEGPYGLGGNVFCLDGDLYY